MAPSPADLFAILVSWLFSKEERLFLFVCSGEGGKREQKNQKSQLNEPKPLQKA